MSFQISVLVGALLAGLFVLVVRLAFLRLENVALAVGLVGAALVYLAAALHIFYVTLNWTEDLVLIEVAGVVLFGLLALAGVRISPWFLAFGWAGHVLWDVLLHPAPIPGGVPDWYPPMCIGFDLVVAGYVALRVAQSESA